MKVIGGLSAVLLVALPQAAWSAEFTGHVADPDGSPVAGATVWLTGEGWDEAFPVFAESRTDATGAFRLACEPADEREGLFAVCVLADGYALAWSGRTRTSRTGILLQLEREFPLHGRIVDGAGRPVVGIRPRLRFLSRMGGFDPLEIGQWGYSIALPESLSAKLVTETDAQGAFEILRLPPGPEAYLEVEAPGYARLCPQWHWTALARGKPIEITLDRGATIRGRVRRADGTPVPGVGVAAFGGGTAQTDEQGQYEIGGLPEAVQQVYLHELPLAFTAQAVEVKVRRGATVQDVDLTVVDGMEVKGIVTDRASGRPVADVGICCNTAQQPKVGSAWPVVRTGEDGRYSIRAPEGPAEIRTLQMPAGWLPAEEFGRDFRRIVITPGEAPFEENFEVVPALSLSGQVLGPDGQPAPGATVVAMNDEDIGFARTVACDADGRFTLPSTVATRRYALGAYRGDDMTLAPGVVEQGATEPVTLQLTADARPTLTGRLVAPDGQPVAYALVRADSGAPRGEQTPADLPAFWRIPMANTLTDEQGRFTFRALFPRMGVVLRLQASGFAQAVHDAPAAQPGGVVDVGDIPLEVADLVVTGKVVDDHGIPVPNVAVEARPLDPSALGRSITASTDLEGNFRFEELPRKDMLLEVDTFNCDSQPVQVGPGRTEVAITAIPKQNQVLYTHQFDPVLQGREGSLACVLRRLYRYKGMAGRGQAEQYLGLDLQLTVDGKPVHWPNAAVIDDRGTPLDQTGAVCRIGEARLPGCTLPDAGVRALTIIVSDRPGEGLYGVASAESLEEFMPAESGGVPMVLGPVATSDRWIEPPGDATAAAHQAPPYLSARLYCLGDGRLQARVVRATAEEEQLELAPVASFTYRPATDELELPDSIAAEEATLRDEAVAALDALEAFGATIPPDAVLIGCCLLSRGGHGAPQAPQPVSALIEVGTAGVVFRNIPLPEELTRARDF